MKKTLALAALLVVVLVGGYLWSVRGSDTSGITSSTSTSTPASGTYTAADVAAHDTAQDCWTIVSGGVYDLTSWVSQHPGGEGPILSICGKDGTSAFLGEHANDSRAQDMLATFRVGALSE